MPMEYYYIQVDSETKAGHLEFRLGTKMESQAIIDFKLIESREISYHSTEGDVVETNFGPKNISLSMVGADSGE